MGKIRNSKYEIRICGLRLENSTDLFFEIIYLKNYTNLKNT